MIKNSFVYKWTDHKNQMFYIGVHKGTIDDGYICSSKIVLEQYKKRPEDFTREILEYGDYKEMLELETRILKEADAKHSHSYYNQHNGDGNFFPKICTEETKKKIGRANSIALKGRKLSEEHKNNMRGRKMTDEQRKKQSERSKGNKYSLGKKWTEEERNKIRGRIAWNKGLKGFMAGPDSPHYGKPLTEKLKNSISNALIGNLNHAKQYEIDGKLIHNLKKYCLEVGWPYKTVHFYMKKTGIYKNHVIKELPNER